MFLLCFLLIPTSSNSQQAELPEGFVFLKDIDPKIIESPRYYSDQNFLGKPVPGYTTPRVICTQEAGEKLKVAHEALNKRGYRLVVYDGYRPQRAVNEFMRWSQDEKDQLAKRLYYPSVDKIDVFKLGYVAEKSGHSRGSTFDLTIIKDGQQLKPLTISFRQLANGESIPFLDDNTEDMGSSFDLFHNVSHHDSKLVNVEKLEKRKFLRDVMKQCGFKEYPYEWWHYTLENEPYPETYFDFIVGKS
ncbi:M15 family metallopeptidase [Candidatus Paracaedibacter symbiosus]|uniref:M15 family metallopeptidase n=1 Tax=Candidatus Paracaedibacter symbiosus TaxID=244582 RepID=UPI00050990A4|nr:M15 family metallopeptidase [Candidatus Paracaedibacter symbiosus]